MLFTSSAEADSEDDHGEDDSGRCEYDYSSNEPRLNTD